MTTVIGQILDNARIRFDFIDTGVWLTARPQGINQAHWDEITTEEKGLYNPVYFEVYRTTDHSEYNIGHFSLAPMPGCCGMVVSFHAFLTKDNRGTGLSDAFRDIKTFIAKKLGYSAMIATTDISNIPALISCYKSGYKLDHQFNNKRTGHRIALGFKEIR